MDFQLHEDYIDVRDLARQVLADQADPERLRRVELSQTRFDAELWRSLGETGLLSVALPEEHGGAGLGLGALVVLLEEQGRHVAPVPVWSAVVAARALARGGDSVQEHLRSLSDGTRRTALALEEHTGEPSCLAESDGDGWVLTGAKALVPTPDGADQILVAAETEAGAGLFLVSADAPGITWEHSVVTSHDLAADLRLDRTRAMAIGQPGGSDAETVRAEAIVAVAAVQLGVAEGALRLAATHLSQRHQFGRPLATFQAVQHQLADCWIDIDAMRVTLWQAVVELDEDPASAAAGRAVRVAQWWSSQAGLDVVHRVQHVHGGLGVDIDYPVHRYFLWGKQLSGTFGGSGATLAVLGDLVAVEEVRS